MCNCWKWWRKKVWNIWKWWRKKCGIFGNDDVKNVKYLEMKRQKEWIMWKYWRQNSGNYRGKWWIGHTFFFISSELEDKIKSNHTRRLSTPVPSIYQKILLLDRVPLIMLERSLNSQLDFKFLKFEFSIIRKSLDKIKIWGNKVRASL